ncbi:MULTISPECIES: DUF5813 family protein [unclassified Haladaptatus]|uniref:DUF5813 family protein n=1 Tax=unclassified Haladaptatus TaxID=2622732 RepID=UPI00209BF027|nr:MULTISPECIES: DUF5813 family protein [unclassified Haladaptatus]MCO8243083.1 DUF5813 family protein [Haladaptatus sp. AB643]MCO8252797.1 DUF5813 family protein [Haladaptatus sp. AB618]
MNRKDAVERAFRLHDGFEDDDEEYVVTTTPFDGSVTVDDSIEVTVRMPTLSAVVTDEPVADVVESGWLETLELRLEDAHSVVSADDATPPTVERDGDEVVLSVEFSGSDKAADDAKAIVDFAEGTWMQGIIPGYEYGEPAAGMLNRAHQQYD